MYNLKPQKFVIQVTKICMEGSTPYKMYVCVCVFVC